MTGSVCHLHTALLASDAGMRLHGGVGPEPSGPLPMQHHLDVSPKGG
jgi:hypothetical protein